MTSHSKEHEGMDQVLVEACQMLYGDAVDPVEFAKMNPDAADMHVPQNLTLKPRRARKMQRRTPGQVRQGALHLQKREPKKLSPEEEKARRERLQGRVGFASNILGITAGAAALHDAAKNPALRGKPLTQKPKLIRPEVFTGKTRALAAGALGLQAANLGGDLVANRVLSREANKPVTPKKKKVVVEKIDPVTVMMGANALRGAVKSKTVRSGVKATGSTIADVAYRSNPRKIAQDKRILELATSENIRLAPARRRNAVIAAALGTAGTGGIIGYKQQKKKVAKSDDITWEGEFAKVDEEKRQVFGWATVTHVGGKEVIDRQSDYIPLEEIEKAAYDYVLTSRVGGDMHRREGDAPVHKADLIESIIFTPEKIERMGLNPDEFPQYGWWMGMKVNDDEQWELVKKGERTGFSIHGKGKRTVRNG